jgi:two-component system, OmpR family, sensor kinase
MPRQRPARGREAVLVARAQRIITAQIAATVTVLVLLAGVTAYLVLTHDQASNDQRQLAMAADHPMTGHPPAHAFDFYLQASSLTRPKGAPSYLPVRAAMNEVAASHGTLVTGYVLDGVSYLIRTQPAGPGVIQVALDLQSDQHQRDELYAAFAFFEIAGLVAAGVTGRLLSRRAIAPLGAAIQRQSQFVADASHELRTPLTQLHTRAQLLQRRLSRDSTATLDQAELDSILASTRQFGEVIEDVLRSAQAQHEPGLRAPVDLPAIVAGVADAEAPRAAAAGVSISVDCDPAVSGLVVSGIAPALRRAVAALVDNALTHSGGGHVAIELTVVPGGKAVEVSVRDDGAGFRPEDGARIFDRAQHAEAGPGGRRPAASQRFGIGLALVREIIDNHGGTITATGRPGEGACFTFRLPCGSRPRLTQQTTGRALARRLRGGPLRGGVEGYLPKHSTH